MTHERKNLQDFKLEDGPDVVFGDNSRGRTVGYGSIHAGSVSFSDVALVDGLKHNLLSISQLCDKGYVVIFTKEGCMVKDAATEEIKLKGQR